MSFSDASVAPLAPLLVTLRFDADSFERLNRLRAQYFPRERNVVPAHLTLFHALPGEHEAIVRETLAQVCARTQTMTLRFETLRFLGRGVAVNVECPELARVRGELRRVFAGFLSAQDSQGWKHPHVTVQNKVTPEAARSTFERLNEHWQGWDGQGEGLTLWYYRGGPWEMAGNYEFVPGDSG